MRASFSLARTQRAALFVAFGSTSALNYAFGLAAGWLLGPTAFGVLAFAQSLILVCGLVLETGVPWALTRDVARAPREHAPNLMRGALGANLLLALGLVLVVSGLFALGPLRNGLEQPEILALACLALLGIAVSTVLRGTAQGREQFWKVAIIQVTEVAAKAGAGIGLVLLGHGVGGALAGFVIGGLLAAVVGAWLLRDVLFAASRLRALKLPSLSTTGWMFGGLLGYALLLNLDLLVVKLDVPDDRAAAGFYQAALLLANLPCYLVTAAVVPLIFPRLVRAERLERTGAVLFSGLRIVLVLVLPIELVLIAAPDTIMHLVFPASFAPAADLLRPLAIARIGLLLVALLAATFQAVGQPRVPALVLVSIAAVEGLALHVAATNGGAPAAAIVAMVGCWIAVALVVAAYLRGAPRTRLRLAGQRA